ncbi:MAG: SEC-C metal-binding domain-containing protein, partial [Acidimicrobiia bacterium]
FYLSLEDELMRLFATGLMQRVMGASFPDDMPLESKMVTKAVERAQRTVEDRNFEIRKNVLKYDEVMNEQRKVIYKRRQQILDGADLREETVSAIADVVQRIVDTHCTGEYSEEWDVDELLRVLQLTYPTKVTADAIRDSFSAEAVSELVLDDVTVFYEEKEESVGSVALREIERRVMLSVIDQHWREHLYEMDYLREGINLRAMGQRDPLSEWQREGYDMFEAMMASIDDNFVRYVCHLQVVAEDDRPRAARNLRYSAAEEPVQGSGALRAAAAATPPEEAPPLAGNGEAAAPASAQASEPVSQEPVRVEKTPGRNEPCYCGSGKKYKLCHGR